VVPTLGLRRPKTPVRGMDVAGTVEAVGGDVTRFQPGDAVFGWTDGSFAEYATAPQDQLAPVPAPLGFEQAGVVPISGFAALPALRDVGEIQAGQRVLVLGAAGGVGSFAVQLAKAFGAEVTGVGSTTQLDLIRSLGADQVVDRNLRAVALSRFVSQRPRMLSSSPRQQDLQTLRELAEAGKLTPVIDRTYPLAEVPDAIRHMEAGHVRGKLVITV
jgi:NADPH:quinone reductase-like Zn-dependent oxidoreductase